jgi:hypothetical protein
MFTENSVSYLLGYCSRHVMLIGIVMNMFLEMAEFVPEEEMTNAKDISNVEKLK